MNATLIRCLALCCFTLVGCGQSQESAAKPPAPARPASLSESKAVIDLQTFPRPSDAQVISVSAGQLSYTTTSTPEVAYKFAAAALAKLGWSEVTEGHQKQIAAEYAQGAFAKQGYALSLSITQSGPKGAMLVQLSNQGNVDARTLPVYPQAKSLYGNASTSMFVTPAKVKPVADFARQQLIAQGWQPYTKAHSAMAEDPDREDLMFKQNGINLNVAISVAPAQQGQTVVQYILSALENELPAPPDATAIEFDAQKPYLTCRSAASIEQVAAFYRGALPGLGWQPRAEKASQAEQSPQTEEKALRMFDAADKSVLILELARADGQTQATLRVIPASVIEAMAKKAAEHPPAEKPATAATPGFPAMPELSDFDLTTGLPKQKLADAEPTDIRPAPSAINARDFPLPPEAKQVVYDAATGEIKFKCPREVAPLVEFYREKLVGWTEDKRFSILNPNLGVVTFAKENTQLKLRLVKVLGPDAEVTVTGNGLAWDAPK